MSNNTLLLHERVDDIPLLIQLMKDMGLDAILNQCLPTHGNHGGLDHGSMALVWLAFILSHGDHRKVTVEPWVKTRRMVLESLLGKPVSEKDFTDDRLSILLKYLSQLASWNDIETMVWQNSLKVLPPNGGLASVRVDATTVSGYHSIAENGLMQRGNSKAHRPDLGQLKLMSASHQPSGCLIASSVHSGESADDPLYVPIIRRVLDMLRMSGLLFVGDCKMAARSTRAFISRSKNFYLTPLPMTGKTKALLEELVTHALEHPGEVQELVGTEDGSRGIEFSRVEKEEIDSESVEWNERLLLIQSENIAQKQRKTLDEHLVRAEKAIRELGSTPGKGKPVFRTEEELRSAIREILERFDVAELLEVTIERQETKKTSYIGRGRGSKSRPTTEKIDIRYRVTAVARNSQKIVQRQSRLGWRIYATNKRAEELSLSQGVIEYRKGWCLERSFHVLKDQPIGISPLYVQTDIQIRGLTHLLLLGNRVLSEIELRVRSSLKAKGKKLAGLKLGALKQETASPTATKILEGVSREEITLTRVTTKAGVSYHMTPLSPLVVHILEHLGLDPSIYRNLAELKMHERKMRVQ